MFQSRKKHERSFYQATRRRKGFSYAAWCWMTVVDTAIASRRHYNYITSSCFCSWLLIHLETFQAKSNRSRHIMTSLLNANCHTLSFIYYYCSMKNLHLLMLLYCAFTAFMCTTILYNRTKVSSPTFYLVELTIDWQDAINQKSTRPKWNFNPTCGNQIALPRVCTVSQGILVRT